MTLDLTLGTLGAALGWEDRLMVVNLDKGVRAACARLEAADWETLVYSEEAGEQLRGVKALLGVAGRAGAAELCADERVVAILTRLLREESHKSARLAQACAGVLAVVSFSPSHLARLSDHHTGLVCMEVLAAALAAVEGYARARDEQLGTLGGDLRAALASAGGASAAAAPLAQAVRALQGEQEKTLRTVAAKYATGQQKQGTIVALACVLLANLARKPKVIGKMVGKGVLGTLEGALKRPLSGPQLAASLRLLYGLHVHGGALAGAAGAPFHALIRDLAALALAGHLALAEEGTAALRREVPRHDFFASLAWVVPLLGLAASLCICSGGSASSTPLCRDTALMACTRAALTSSDAELRRAALFYLYHATVDGQAATLAVPLIDAACTAGVADVTTGAIKTKREEQEAAKATAFELCCAALANMAAHAGGAARVASAAGVPGLVAAGLGAKARWALLRMLRNVCGTAPGPLCDACARAGLDLPTEVGKLATKGAKLPQTIYRDALCVLACLPLERADLQTLAVTGLGKTLKQTLNESLTYREDCVFYAICAIGTLCDLLATHLEILNKQKVSISVPGDAASPGAGGGRSTEAGVSPTVVTTDAAVPTSSHAPPALSPKKVYKTLVKQLCDEELVGNLESVLAQMQNDDEFVLQTLRAALHLARLDALLDTELLANTKIYACAHQLCADANAVVRVYAFRLLEVAGHNNDQARNYTVSIRFNAFNSRWLAQEQQRDGKKNGNSGMIRGGGLVCESKRGVASTDTINCVGT